MTVTNLHDAGPSGQIMPMEYHVQQQLVPSNNARAHYDGSGSQIAINNPSVLGTPSEEMVERIQALPIRSYPIRSYPILPYPILILSDPIRSPSGATGALVALVALLDLSTRVREACVRLCSSLQFEQPHQTAQQNGPNSWVYPDGVSHRTAPHRIRQPKARSGGVPLGVCASRACRFTALGWCNLHRLSRARSTPR